MNISGQWVRLPHIMVACVINSQHLEPWLLTPEAAARLLTSPEVGEEDMNISEKPPIRMGDSLKVDIDFPIFLFFLKGEQVTGEV